MNCVKYIHKFIQFLYISILSLSLSNQTIFKENVDDIFIEKILNFKNLNFFLNNYKNIETRYKLIGIFRNI